MPSGALYQRGARDFHTFIYYLYYHTSISRSITARAFLNAISAAVHAPSRRALRFAPASSDYTPRVLASVNRVTVAFPFRDRVNLPLRMIGWICRRRLLYQSENNLLNFSKPSKRKRCLQHRCWSGSTGRYRRAAGHYWHVPQPTSYAATARRSNL